MDSDLLKKKSDMNTEYLLNEQANSKQANSQIPADSCPKV